MMLIPIVIGALGIFTKRLLKGQEDFEIKERVETIQIAALLNLARIERNVVKIWVNLVSDSSKRSSAKADVKNIPFEQMVYAQTSTFPRKWHT